MRILLFFISSCFFWISTVTLAQDSIPNDSIPKFKEKYGLRLGGDAHKLARSFYDADYTGFEINGDYRLTKKLYLAGEIGVEEKITTTDFLNTTTSGSYLRAGVDYNFYQNWLDMENMLYGGFRIGAAAFSQELNSFSIYDVNNQFWNEQFSSTEPLSFNDLTAIWTEIVFGLKVQVVTNLYLGLNVQLKVLVTETTPDNFDNLFIPGFNRTFDNSRISAGFGYTISYLIPIYKKDK